MTGLKVVAGLEVDRGYAFRPSSLEKEGVRVWFRHIPRRVWCWHKFRFVPAVLIVEMWTDYRGTFEPGNCWIERT